MAETSTKKLVEDVDNAVRDAYQAVRTALHKVEDLKIAIIRQPDVNTFGPEHDEMYKMYIDLSKRFQTIRDELSVRDNSSLVQPPPQLPPQPPPRPPTPGPTPGPAPDMDEPRIVKPPVQRNKSRPYVLVPVGFVTLSQYTVTGRFSSIVAAKVSFQRSRPARQWRCQSM